MRLLNKPARVRQLAALDLSGRIVVRFRYVWGYGFIVVSQLCLAVSNGPMNRG